MTNIAIILQETDKVVVTHGLSYTPNLQDIILTPLDNLEGRSVWSSDANATTFTINISSIDSKDHSIGYAFIQPTTVLLENLYATLGDCKAMLRVTDATHDAEITSAIYDASRHIDTFLKLYGTVPLTGSIPSSVTLSAKYFACAIYLRMFPISDVSFKQADAYWQMASEEIDEYIRRTYYVGKAFST